MKKKTIILPLLRILSLVIIITIAGAPLSVLAATNRIEPIIITEVQVGTAASASQEFIELYNQSASVVDLATDKWQVQIATSKATTWERPRTVSLSGKFYPGKYMIVSSNYVLSGETKSYLQDYATAQFTSGLTATTGHIRLVHGATASTAEVQAGDALEWSTKDTTGKPVSAGIDEAPVLLLDMAIENNASIKRATDEDHVFMASGDLDQDYLLSNCPSPTANNVAPTSPGRTQSEPIATSIDITNPSCTTSETDPEDGGGTTQPTEDPPAVLLPSEEPTETNSHTTKTSAHMSAADVGLASPQISEVLPNPASPQTDAEDEFIELYNSNNASFDLSGFILEVGITGSKHYTFPKGTIMAPHSFRAFFAADTHISLSNTSGQVKLLDPFEKLLLQTEPYSTAKDDQAWALANGKWQWTTRPSPNATNTIAAPVAKAAKVKTTSAKAAAKKSTATNSKSPTAAKTTDMAIASDTQQASPLHPLALAVAGGFALLYGGYEYRHDVANKFHQLRSYRAARRKNRQSVARR